VIRASPAISLACSMRKIASMARCGSAAVMAAGQIMPARSVQAAAPTTLILWCERSEPRRAIQIAPRASRLR
jgi:hypothetical protein